jgi:hypothetical protein
MNSHREKSAKHAALALRTLAEMADTWPDQNVRRQASTLLAKYLSKLESVKDRPDTSANTRADIEALLSLFRHS